MALHSTRRRRIVTTAGPSILSVVVAGMLFACGSSDEKKPAAKPDPFASPGLLSDRQVQQAKRGSPQRAFLAWWQAVQYRDSVTAYSLSTPSARDGLTEAAFTKEASDAAAGFAARPQIVGSSVSGNTTTLRTRLIFYSAGKKSAVVPLAFQMAKRGRWLVDDLSYLREQASLGRERSRNATAKPNATPPAAQGTNTTTAP